MGRIGLAVPESGAHLILGEHSPALTQSFTYDPP